MYIQIRFCYVHQGVPRVEAFICEALQILRQADTAESFSEVGHVDEWPDVG